MREIAQQLISYEATAASQSEVPVTAAHRVLESSASISTLVGFQGYRVLLLRALTLAKVKDPLLHAVTIQPDASLSGLSETNAETSKAAGVILTTQLLQLLSMFIGKELTIHILMGVWPNLIVPSTTISQEEEHDQAK